MTIGLGEPRQKEKQSLSERAEKGNNEVFPGARFSFHVAVFDADGDNAKALVPSFERIGTRWRSKRTHGHGEKPMKIKREHIYMQKNEKRRVKNQRRRPAPAHDAPLPRHLLVT